MADVRENIARREVDYLTGSHLKKALPALGLAGGSLAVLAFTEPSLTVADVVSVLCFSVLLGYVVPTLHDIRLDLLATKWDLSTQAKSRAAASHHHRLKES
jgi:hypothetical protein